MIHFAGESPSSSRFTWLNVVSASWLSPIILNPNPNAVLHSGTILHTVLLNYQREGIVVFLLNRSRRLACVRHLLTFLHMFPLSHPQVYISTTQVYLGDGGASQRVCRLPPRTSPGCQQSGAPPALSGSSAAVSPRSAGRMMFAQSGLPGETGIIVRLLAWGM